MTINSSLAVDYMLRNEFRLASEKMSPSDARDWVNCKAGDIVRIERFGIAIHGMIVAIINEGKRGLPRCIKVVKIYSEIIPSKWFDDLSGHSRAVIFNAREILLDRVELLLQISSYTFRDIESPNGFEIIDHLDSTKKGEQK